MQRPPLSSVTYLAWGLLGVGVVYTLISFYIVRLPLSSFFLAIIRWAHFVGAFTAVGAIFTGLMIVSPILKTLSIETQSIASHRLLPTILAVHVFGIDITMAAGVPLAWFLSGGNLLAFVSTRWGISVLAAGILTLAMQGIADFALRRNGFAFNAHSLSGISSYMSASSEVSSTETLALQTKLARTIRLNSGLALLIMFLMGFAAHGAI